MDSLEKIEKLKQGTTDLAPDDEGSARMLQVLQFATGSGMLEGLIPDTAGELDDMLLNVAKLTLGMRSDDAAVRAQVAVANTAEASA